eukprot:567577-Rhodomonas_salina.1
MHLIGSESESLCPRLRLRGGLPVKQGAQAKAKRPPASKKKPVPQKSSPTKATRSDGKQSSSPVKKQKQQSQAVKQGGSGKKSPKKAPPSHRSDVEVRALQEELKAALGDDFAE